jgi:hypothetical protein
MSMAYGEKKRDRLIYQVRQSEPRNFWLMDKASKNQEAFLLPTSSLGNAKNSLATSKPLSYCCTNCSEYSEPA